MINSRVTTPAGAEQDALKAKKTSEKADRDRLANEARARAASEAQAVAKQTATDVNGKADARTIPQNMSLQVREIWIKDQIAEYCRANDVVNITKEMEKSSEKASMQNYRHREMRTPISAEHSSSSERRSRLQQISSTSRPTARQTKGRPPGATMWS